MADYRVVDCTLEEHGKAILEIFNDAILNSTALFDYEPRTPENMVSWFETKRVGNFPVIGVVTQENVLVGFASMGAFRPFPANKYTVEHSVYVHKDHRGEGLGRRLLELIIDAAKQRELHVMIGGITADNIGSIELHKKLGFVHVGTLPEVGFKFGQWQDLAFYQLTIDTPAHPVDG
jgi:L-amino acid N-acyltransferase